MSQKYKISFFLILGLHVNAKDFGTVGQTFPILERNLKNVIEEKIAHSNLESMPDKLEEMAKNPKAIHELQEAKEYKSYIVDPSYTAKEDIKNDKGQIVVKQGTKINPLEIITLSTRLIFIDGTDQRHLSWARSLTDDVKWILVKGSPIFLEEIEQRPIYFDQNGQYVKKLQIQHLPASAKQEGPYLLIEEWPLDSLCR